MVAIISLLASIAVPRFLSSTYRARRSEAYTVLGGARQAQYLWIGLYSCFASFRRTPEGGAVPNNSKRSWVSAATNNPDRCQAVDYAFADSDLTPAGPVYHFYECEARPSPADFACSAVGDVDADGVQAEYIFCTDHDGAGCIASASGQISLFPFEVLPVSGSVY